MKRRREEDIVVNLAPLADTVRAALAVPHSVPSLSPDLAQLFLAWRASSRSQQEERFRRLAVLDESARRASEASERVEQARYELALLAKALEAQRTGTSSEYTDLSALEDEIRISRQCSEHAAALRGSVDDARATQQRLEARLNAVIDARATLRSAAAPIASRIEQVVALPPADASLVGPLQQLYLFLSLSGVKQMSVRIVATPPPSIASEDYVLRPHGLEITWGVPPTTFYVAAVASLSDLLVARGATARDDTILGTLVLGDDGVQPSDARLAFARPGFQFDASVVGRPYRLLARLAGVNQLPPLSEPTDPAESFAGHELLNYLLARSGTQ